MFTPRYFFRFNSAFTSLQSALHLAISIEASGVRGPVLRSFPYGNFYPRSILATSNVYISLSLYSRVLRLYRGSGVIPNDLVAFRVDSSQSGAVRRGASSPFFGVVFLVSITRFRGRVSKAYGNGPPSLLGTFRRVRAKVRFATRVGSRTFVAGVRNYSARLRRLSYRGIRVQLGRVMPRV